jgi:hypothetical protein
VWSYDEKGVSPDGKWTQVYVSAVEEINGKMVAVRRFRTTTGEKADFWTTIGLWTRADGQCPVEPIVVAEAAKLSLNQTENLGLMVTPWCNKSGDMHPTRYGLCK